jgi:predicted Fe-Mo cluster-binding NifX family protein
MKVAIPSDNRETITKRTGQSKGFMVYNIVDKRITGTEFRENSMGQHDEEAEHSHAEIIELLKDVDILLVAAIGKYMKRDVENSPIKYQMVREEKLTQIMDNFLKTNKMDKVDKKQIEETIESVMHPAINLSLTTLGIVKDIQVTNEKVEVTFAFPFPNIPIGEQLINSVKLPVTNLGVAFDYQIVIMTEEEKQRFLQLEASAWKGM